MATLPPLVLDHDGTLTDLDQSFDHYVRIAKAYLAKHLPLPGLAAHVDECLAQILANPGDYGWQIEGRVVAPASDQYLVMHQVVDLLDPGNEKLKTDLFQSCYPQAPSPYKPGVKQLLTKLSQQAQIFIVTNSATADVEVKLASLLTPQELTQIHLVGNAQKMVIDQDWQGVVPPGPHPLPLFPARGVYLERRAYYNVLTKICGGHWADLTVVGDIGEMDLALPDYLGCRTVLVPTHLTPPWEREYWQRGAPRRYATPLHTLPAILL